MNISLIAAMDRNMAIGFENTLPWHIPTDMQHFRKTTTGQTILMGRNTLESMGKALPNRTNLVLSRNETWSAPNVTRVASIEHAIELLHNSDTAGRLWVIGGAQVYSEAIKVADELVLTRLHMTLNKADAYFPSFDHKEWYLESSETLTDQKTGIVLDIEVWKKHDSK